MADPSLVIGIDLGGTHVQAGLVDASGRVVHRLGTETRSERGPEGVTRRLGTLVEELLSEAHTPLDAVAAIGVGAPGAVDHETGVVYNAPNLRWSDFPLAERLSALVGGRPVRVDNDVNVAVLGENRFGAGRNAPDAFGVWVGTGVGGGIILDHKLFRGPMGSAAEVGQTTLFPDLPIRKGVMEAHCSRSAVQRLLRQAVESGEDTAAADIVYGDIDSITPKEIAIAYKDKDPAAERVVNRAADLIGISIANAIGLLSIPLVLMGGGLVEAMGQPYVDRVQRSFRERLFPRELADRVEFRMTELRDNAGLLGAALIAIDHAALRAPAG